MNGEVGRAVRNEALRVGLLLAVMNAGALTILRNQIGGDPGGMDIGDGNLADIFNAAADIWELAIGDDHVLTLHYGWGPVGGGLHVLHAQDGWPNRETEGIIMFNNDLNPGCHHYYVDPTPRANDEFGPLAEESIEAAGRWINATRVFREGPESEDLLTVALHEIGHALGLSYENASFKAECGDGEIDFVSMPVLVGTGLRLQTNNSGVTSHIDYRADRLLMAGSIAPGERVLPSALDILVVGELSRFTNLNVNLAPKLQIEVSDAHVLLTWREIIGDYVLERNPDPRQTNRWVVAGLEVGTCDDAKSVIMPVSTQCEFYRLRETGPLETSGSPGTSAGRARRSKYSSTPGMGGRSKGESRGYVPGYCVEDVRLK